MITGTYVIKSNGEVIGEYTNMITANGLLKVNQFLTGDIQGWADSLAVGGLSSVSTASTTTALQHEFARYPILFKTYQSASGSNRILFKTSLNINDQFDIYELGLIPSKVELTTFMDHVTISSFSESTSGSSNWYINSVPATFSSASPTPRFGYNSIVLGVSGNSLTNTASISALTIESGRYTGNDYVGLLYHCSSNLSGTSSVTVSFGDSSDTQLIWSGSATVSSIVSGSSYTVLLDMQDKPSEWIDPISTASIKFAGTSGSVYLDHMKFVLGDQLLTDLQLVSRSTSASLTVPLFKKTYGQPMDIEYYLQVT